MSELTEYPEGAPCWPELTTLNPARAKEFYGPLLGWTFEEYPFKTERGDDVYTVCLADGKRVAGLMPHTESRKSLPAAWNIYLASKDVDQTVRRIEPNAGTILMAPSEIPGFGRMAYALDPSGAPFGIWQGREHKGSERYADLHAMCWSEITTFDGPRVDAFYQAIFDTIRQKHIGGVEEGSAFTGWIVNNHLVSGCRELNPEWSGHLPAQWLMYFVVSDCDAAAAEVVRRGGKVRRPVVASPHGQSCIATGPDGAWFGLCEHTVEACTRWEQITGVPSLSHPASTVVGAGS